MIHPLFSVSRVAWEQIWAEYVDPNEVVTVNKYLAI
jgi:hypothetical protein